MKQSAYLVLNSGSSSLKFSLILSHNASTHLTGLAECLNSPDASISINYSETAEKQTISLPNADHKTVLNKVLDVITAHSDKISLAGVGHRVVHGGEKFKGSTLITNEVQQEIEACNPLAPLHNPANLLGIQQISILMPELPQVAVFDTAFHQTIPEKAFLYALPYEYYQELGVRKYGFHGTSHQFVMQQAIETLNLDPESNGLITAHLGNGSSVCAIKNSKSIDTSMGLTPLAGLVMGTRSGDIDPGLHAFLVKKLDISLEQLTSILNKKSGLLGLSGETNDMRKLCQLAETGHLKAQIALEVFCYVLAKQIASLSVNLEQLNAIVFTGGIGENSALIRQKTVDNLAIFKLKLEPTLNKNNGDESGVISCSKTSNYKVMVIATNEELMIAKQTQSIIESGE